MHFMKTAAISLASAIAVANGAMIYSCTQPNTIALTFDDGLSAYTNELLDTLATTPIKVTFFVNGKNWLGDLTNNPEAAATFARMAQEGHQIATHTWAHKVPPTNPERLADIDQLNTLIEKSAGFRPTYFRAPLGECDEACIAFYEQQGMKVIQWDTDTNDWNIEVYQNQGMDEASARAARVAEAKKFLTEEWALNKPSYLVLMHDVQVHTVKEIVPWLVKNAPLDKYKFVTVAECLGDATLGKGTAAGEAALQASATNAATSTPLSLGMVPGNTTVSNLQNNATSGAFTVSSNFYVIAALFAYSLYMLF